MNPDPQSKKLLPEKLPTVLPRALGCHQRPSQRFLKIWGKETQGIVTIWRFLISLMICPVRTVSKGSHLNLAAYCLYFGDQDTSGKYRTGMLDTFALFGERSLTRKRTVDTYVARHVSALQSSTARPANPPAKGQVETTPAPMRGMEGGKIQENVNLVVCVAL